MKTIGKFWISAILSLSVANHAVMAQKVDDERMKRDIEVAENVLATLIKQELAQQRSPLFIGLDVKGTYQPGYGVTFRLPPDNTVPYAMSIVGDDVQGATVISDGDGYRVTFRYNDLPEPPEMDKGTVTLSDRIAEKKELILDSARDAYNDRIIRAAQNFILDYGDFLSQLQPTERIVVTNQSDRPHFYFNRTNRTRLSVEGSRADVTAFRQGKISREQALKKLTVVRTETLDKKEPDLEMLSSILFRLYRPDLSKTYFAEGNVYYERLRDFGAIFYMRVVSSNQRSLNRYYMPTIGLDNVDQETRDKKVTELYPAFEQDVRENLIEYGRTVKSLENDESLILNIAMTKCGGCGIPSTLELSVKASDLKDFASGKIDKNAAMKKIIIKKGENQ